MCSNSSSRFCITDISIENFTTSRFLEPLEIHYTLNGKRQKWDCVRCDDSVTVIVYNISRAVLVLVKQFRPAVYMSNMRLEDRINGPIDLIKYPLELGYTLEFCAGIVDKTDKSVEEAASREVKEEIGYDVSEELFEKIGCYKNGTGLAVHNIDLFFVEVTDDMKTSIGGGVPDEGEAIEVVELSLNEASELMNSKKHSVNLMHCLQWFFLNKRYQKDNDQAN